MIGNMTRDEKMLCMVQGCGNVAGPHFSFQLEGAVVTTFQWCESCFEQYIWAPVAYLHDKVNPPTVPTSFGYALRQLKAGSKVARAGWNGKGMWLALQVPDAHSKMGHPYLYMSGVDGKFFPWTPNTLDMLAEDWSVVT